MFNSKREINKAFVLNLSSKNEKLKEKLNSLNIPNKFDWEIILGIKGTNTNIKWKPFPTWELKGHSNFWWNRPLLEGEVGCALGHYLMWKQAYEEGYELSLFLEEDFNVVHSLENLDLSELPQDLDGFYLGRNKLNPNEVEEEVGDNWFKASYSYNLQSYCLTRSGLEKILKYDFLNNIMPSDEFLPATYTEHPRKDVAETIKPTLNFYAHKIEHITQTSSEKISQTENSEPLKEIRVIDYKITEKQKIVDSILFFNELDLLELRFEELYDYVDLFLIVESDKTFTGKDKPLYYRDNIKRFSKWSDKIRHYVVNDMPTSVSNDELLNHTTIESQKTIEFYRESHQRNSIGKALRELNLDFDDIVLVSDVDEFPNIQIFDKLNKTLPYGPIVFKQKWLVWNTHLEKMHHWMGSTAFYYSHYISNNKVFQQVRDRRWGDNEDSFSTQENGGFHFSWFGNFDFIRQKLNAFSHTELVTDFWDSDDNITNLIKDMYASNGFEKNGTTGKLIPFTQENYHLPKVWEKIKKLEISCEKPKIYDCFLFDHELDMLNLRLHEMNDYVDHFILIESRNSHTGKDKELFFQKHKNLFKKFNHKIEHIVIDLPNEVLYEPQPLGVNDEDNLNKFRENYNRNAIKDTLERINPNDNDVILISDVDEIWGKDILSKLKYNQVSFNTFKTILQRWHYWNFKWDFEDMFWPGPAFCRWSYLKTTTPQKIRNVRYEQDTHLDGINGWHLSWFGNVECNMHKLRNTHHQELNIYSKDKVKNMIDNGYLFDGEKMTSLSWDYYPDYRNLIEDGELYKNIHA